MTQASFTDIQGIYSQGYLKEGKGLILISETNKGFQSIDDIVCCMGKTCGIRT